MGVFIGPYDPIKLAITLINTLLKKGLITVQEAKDILKQSLNPSMSDDEKDKFIESLFRRQ